MSDWWQSKDRMVRSLGPLAMSVVLIAGALNCRQGPAQREGSEGNAEAVAVRSEIELERARAACTAYQERLCTCADADTADAQLAERCHLAKAKLKSLNMVISVHTSTGDADERGATAETVQRYTRSCLEQANALATDLSLKRCTAQTRESE